MIVKLGENWPVPVASGGDRAFNVKEQNFGGGENQEKQERGKGGEGGEKQKKGGKEEQEGEKQKKRQSRWKFSLDCPIQLICISDLYLSTSKYQRHSKVIC